MSPTTVVSALMRFLGPVRFTRKGIVNAEEKLRAILVALAAGTPAQLIAAVLAVRGLHASAVVVQILTPLAAFVIEYVRRYFHEDPVQSAPFSRN